MQRKKYTFADPTGGGEDATLTLPVWAKPPHEIPGHHEDGTVFYFELEDEDGEDEDE